MPGGAPLAYFLTFTTYGTWFHGDARGSVDRTRNQPGEPGIDPSPSLVRHERDVRMTRPPVVFDFVARQVVGDALAETCAFRGWQLLAANVRTTHVHVVVVADERPEVVLTALKANATRLLVERAKLSKGSRVWTRHGSTRYLWEERDVEDACTYTVEFQDAASGRWERADGG